MTSNSPAHGIVTPHNDVLEAVNATATTVAVIDAKLSIYIQRDEERKGEVEAMRSEMTDLKVKVYSMAAILSIVLSAVTAWITNQVS